MRCVRVITKEYLISMCQTENVSFSTYRKTAHPQVKNGFQGWKETEINDTLNIFDYGESRTPTLILENHPADSRVKIREDNVFQTLSSRMGTGGATYLWLWRTAWKA